MSMHTYSPRLTDASLIGVVARCRQLQSLNVGECSLLTDRVLFTIANGFDDHETDDGTDACDGHYEDGDDNNSNSNENVNDESSAATDNTDGMSSGVNKESTFIPSSLSCTSLPSSTRSRPCQYLRSLDLFWCQQITLAGIRALRFCPSLQTLQIEHCSIHTPIAATAGVDAGTRARVREREYENGVDSNSNGADTEHVQAHVYTLSDLIRDFQADNPECVVSYEKPSLVSSAEW